MAKPGSSSGIKSKIVAGFMILLTLIFVSVLSIIKLSSRLTPPDPGISSSVARLTTTSNLLSGIIRSDGYARAFINTGDSVYLEKFRQQDEYTQRLLDTLISGSISNTNQFLRMLTVDSLLRVKNATFVNFFELRNRETVKQQLDFGRILPRYNDTMRVPNRTVAKTVTQNYPQQEEKKKGFFPRIWSGITGKKKADSLKVPGPVLDVTYDTVVTYKTVRDTTISRIRSQLKQIERKQNIARELTTQREMMLIQADQDIMNEIRSVLLLFEKEEIAKAISETEKSKGVLRSLWNTALILAGMGLLATISFIIIIWKDLARSAFYRRRLEEARALAESLLKVKEQFLANMSHEIRTPLTSIIGFSERLTETRVDNEQSRYIRYIISSSEHLLELINDLLDFSRIGSGKFTLESRAFNPGQLFEEAFESLAQKGRDKGLELIFRQNNAPVTLAGDPLRIRQIIINLLNNSIKFTDTGKVMLQTKVTPSADNTTANILIRVADSGIGIPADKLEYIFEEFSQVDHSITRRFGGSGLGLAITKKLVEMMNGSINVFSRQEQGTIFTVKLTLPVVADSKETVTAEDGLTTDLHGISILVAEDDETTRMLITGLLTKYNAEVTGAENGQEAWELFRERNGEFEYVITDIRMPGLSGPELVGKITEDCKSRNVSLPKIIGLTAHADQNEINDYKQAGIDYFILKPFRGAEILKALNVKDQETEEDSGDTTLDYSDFRKFAGDEDSLNRILLSLESTIGNTADEMKAAKKAGDYAALGLLAHRLIPNIKLLGAKPLAEKLKLIEAECKKEEVDKESINVLLKQVTAELMKIRVKLRSANSPAS